MGTVPIGLARDLKRQLTLRHGVETGTYTGRGALLLSEVFASVTTIERSEDLARETAAALLREPIRVVQGDSRKVLRPSREPTFYFLDGHWSGGRTAGEGDECPVLDELDAIAGGSPDDCIVIDDARLFVQPPPPPHDPGQWPSIAEVESCLARHWPGHVVVVAHDQIVAAPERAAGVVHAFAAAPFQAPARDRSPMRRLTRKLRKARRLVARWPGG
jgi:hypothetical protein